MVLRMLHDCWVSPGGQGLRFFRSDECYSLSCLIGEDLIHRGFATALTFGEFMTQFPPRVLTLVTPPEYEPLTLAEVKLFLRVDGSEEDGLIIQMLSAAREKLEAWLRKSLLTQTWELTQRITPQLTVRLPMSPIQTVNQVQVVPLSGATTLTVADYHYLPESQEIQLNAGLDAERVVVQYVAGYVDASQIPAALRHALLHLISHYYHHREAVGEIPAEIKRMVADYREVRI
jgi:uncharacterized phiE125 gp8 family phage protein